MINIFSIWKLDMLVFIQNTAVWRNICLIFSIKKYASVRTSKENESYKTNNTNKASGGLLHIL